MRVIPRCLSLRMHIHRLLLLCFGACFLLYTSYNTRILKLTPNVIKSPFIPPMERVANEEDVKLNERREKVAPNVNESLLLPRVERVTDNEDVRVDERRKKVKKACAARGEGNDDDEPIHVSLWKGKKTEHKPHLYFSDKRDFLVCATPKCGSTEWRNLILILDGIVDAYSADSRGDWDPFKLAVKTRFLWKAFYAESSEGRHEIEFRLNRYSKIMLVREPLERLVSAYKDKMEWRPGGKPHDVRFEKHSSYVHKVYGNGSKGLASFSEFIDYVLDTKPDESNAHWRPYTLLCDACNVKYDYILKMETIYADVEYVADKIGFERDRIFNDTQQGSMWKWKTDYHGYFDQLIPSKRKDIFEYYKFQYDAFGYPYPDFI